MIKSLYTKIITIFAGSLSTQDSNRDENYRFIFCTALILILITFRLWIAAVEFDNYRGFWISFIHTLCVAFGVLISLKK